MKNVVCHTATASRAGASSPLDQSQLFILSDLVLSLAALLLRRASPLVTRVECVSSSGEAIANTREERIERGRLF